MFSTDPQGRLVYGPFTHYQLPRLVYVIHDDGKGNAECPTHVEFARKQGDTDGDGFGPPQFHRPLYRLRWPGETSGTNYSNQVPGNIIDTWPDPVPKGRYAYVDYKGAWLPLETVLHHWNGIDPLPEGVQYHAAVNGMADIPVAGLPAIRVAQVLDTRFALDQQALATLRYLKWQAETLRDCPFFQGFDTNIRETLYGLQHEAVRLFFYLLADYRYDAENRWWDRGMSRFVWQRLATYLHWVGRTGCGCYAELSHIEPAEGIRPDVVADEMQDVLTQIKQHRHGYLAEEPFVEGPSIEVEDG